MTSEVGDRDETKIGRFDEWLALVKESDRSICLTTRRFGKSSFELVLDVLW